MDASDPHSHYGFHEALNKFTAQLTTAEVEAFKKSSLDDVRLVIAGLPKGQATQRSLRCLSRFLESMEQYEDLSQTYLRISEFSLFIWGPMSHIFLVSSTRNEALVTTLDMYGSIGTALPLLKPYECVFEANVNGMGEILELLLIDFMVFHERTLHGFRCPAWEQILRSTQANSRTRLQSFLHDLKQYQNAVEHQAFAFQLRGTERIQAEAEKQGIKMMEGRIQRWFSAARNCTDQEIIAKVRAGFNSEDFAIPRKRHKVSSSTSPPYNLTWLRDAPYTEDHVSASSPPTKNIQAIQVSLARYQYTSLTPRSAMRLLRVLPASPETETLDCELVEVHDLDGAAPDQAHSYEALSWCWGKETKDKEIRIHGDRQLFSFMISLNLISALKALRPQSQPKIVWVDAICINQDDPEEKSWQVARMDEIYAQAQTVRVWLGDGDENSEIAFDFIRSDLSGLWKLDKAFESAALSRKWIALTSLMQRPWFTRRWVIQEIALARNSILHCGKDILSWRDFADAVHLLLTREAETPISISNSLSRSTESNLSGRLSPISALGASRLVLILDSLFHRDTFGRVELLSGLEHLVSISSIFQATEPQDTIFALLSLAKDTALAAKSAGSQVDRPLYPVNYQTEFHNVCKDFVLFCIQNTNPSRALDIICRPWAPSVTVKSKKLRTQRYNEKPISASKLPLDSGRSKDASVEPTDFIPSWVCDVNDATFKMHSHPATGPHLARKNPDPFVGLPDEPTRYYAAGDMHVRLSSLEFKSAGDYHSMFVRGFIYNQVSVVAEPSRLGNIPADWFELAGWYDPRTDPPEQLWRTLVADQGPNMERCPPVYALVAKDCFQWSFEQGIPGSTFDITNMIGTVSNSIASAFLTKVQNVIWNRSLMLLDSGNIGLTHENTREGDFVCILYGCSVPVILRRLGKGEDPIREQAAQVIQRAWRRCCLNSHVQANGGGGHSESGKTSQYYYELVGACYVNGIMYGEAMRLHSKAQVRSETFEIR